jgi:putative hydrolase of HD superfamily
MGQVYLKAIQENSDSIFEFILKLKRVPRAGWQKKLGIRKPESVADHAYSVAAIAMMLSDSKNLDSEKILKMAILHDLAESVIGDLTPEDGPKQKKEAAAMKKILSQLDQTRQKQYWSLWMEYQKNTTKEARLLHDVDKLEMALQARQYQKDGHSKKKLLQFFDSAIMQTKDPDIQETIRRLKH